MDPNRRRPPLTVRRRFVRPMDVSLTGLVDDAPGWSEPRPRVRRIALTGGPGGGKSTAAAFLAREFADAVWVLPEAATLLYRGGLPRGAHEDAIRIAQRCIFDVQDSLERAWDAQHPDRIQVCDRGTVDGAAYWPDGPDAFFAAMGTTQERELARYDAVIFLHTAAMLPAGYERDLDVRTEEVDVALSLDARVHDLWSAHPRFIPVHSTGSFLDKLSTVTQAVRWMISTTPPVVDDVIPMRV